MRIVCENKDKWLQIRKGKISATKVSAIFGVSRYESGQDVYEYLVGNKDDVKEETERMKNGALAEEHIRELFIIRHRNKYELVPQEKGTYVFFTDDEYSFIGTSCDGEIIDLETNEQGALEIKFFDGYSNGIHFTKDQIREDCYLQCLHELRTSKKDFIIFIVALNYDDTMLMREYYIHKNSCEEDVKLILDTIVDFYNKYVVTKKRPPLMMDF